MRVQIRILLLRSHLMKDVYGENDPVYLKGKKLFESFLDSVARDVDRGYYVALNGEKRENEIYHLTHLLLSSLVDKNSRIKTGYDLSDERVKKIVGAIVDSQREDGGWRPFWAEESDPVYTVLALKLLVFVGVLKVEELRPRFEGAFGGVLEFVEKAREAGLETEITVVRIPEVGVGRVREIAERGGVGFRVRDYIPCIW